MNLHLHSTERHAVIDGALCRVYEGTTGNGSRVTAYVRQIAVVEPERELDAPIEPAPDTERSVARV